MSFASARFEPDTPPYDRAALAALLDAAPHAFADPHGADTWHLSANQRLAARARAARVADPTRFPPGVLVRLRDEGVLIDQQGGAADLARGREIVEWLLARGRWQVVTEYGARGWVTDVAQLYPDPLPDPATLTDDPLGTPPLDGRIWRWELASGALVVHLPSGACGFEGPGGVLRCRGQLGAEALAAFEAAVAGLSLESIDEGAPDWVAVAVRWEDADGEDDVAYFRADEVPAVARPLAALAVPWAAALAGWSPPDAVPHGLVRLVLA